MTLSEFKAWFEGFTECMEGAPDEKQWQRIKARVKEIDGVAITKTVFVDRYVEVPYRRGWWENPIVSYGASSGGTALLSTSGASRNDAVASLNAERFDSRSALHDLGKAEYSAALAS